MLGKILSHTDCAKCQICCTFDNYDLWETPVITRDKCNQILQEFKPDQKFITSGNHFVLKMEKQPDEELYYCPMLDRKKGCIMGDQKPFDCKIWPFRIMNLHGTDVITLSPVCPVVKTKGLDEIMQLCKELAPTIFEEADKHPEYVKPYIVGYPIIEVRGKRVVKD